MWWAKRRRGDSLSYMQFDYYNIITTNVYICLLVSLYNRSYLLLFIVIIVTQNCTILNKDELDALMA